ncbi:MAG: hypothetical protein FJZ58_07270 [Chlamydiae bacterium]|nr:hypothetical protein [Chlamydiota bacterium]MBM3199030.1 hypothetical protein [Chlamydiota bacterium]
MSVGGVGGVDPTNPLGNYPGGTNSSCPQNVASDMFQMWYITFMAEDQGGGYNQPLNGLTTSMLASTINQFMTDVKAAGVQNLPEPIQNLYNAINGSSFPGGTSLASLVQGALGGNAGDLSTIQGNFISWMNESPSQGSNTLYDVLNNTTSTYKNEAFHGDLSGTEGQAAQALLSELQLSFSYLNESPPNETAFINELQFVYRQLQFNMQQETTPDPFLSMLNNFFNSTLPGTSSSLVDLFQAGDSETTIFSDLQSAFGGTPNLQSWLSSLIQEGNNHYVNYF